MMNTDPRVALLVTTQTMLEDVCPLVLNKMASGWVDVLLKKSNLRLHRVVVQTETGSQTSLHLTAAGERYPTQTLLLDSASLLDLPERLALLADLCAIAFLEVK